MSYTWPVLWQGAPGCPSAGTAIIEYGAFKTRKELKKACSEIIPHAEVNHIVVAQRIYFKMLSFHFNKTKAVWDSLLCLLSNEHQHDNYIKIDRFKNVYFN